MQIPPSQTWTLHSTTGLNSPEPCYECAWAHCKPASAVTSLHILHSSPQTSIWACRDSFKRHGIGINTHKVKGNKWWGILEGTGKEETESKWLVQKEKNKKSVSVWHFQVSSRTEKSEDSPQKTAWQQVAGDAMVPWQGIRKPQGLTTSRVRLLGADGSYLRKGWAEPRSVVPAGQIGGRNHAWGMQQAEAEEVSEFQVLPLPATGSWTLKKSYYFHSHQVLNGPKLTPGTLAWNIPKNMGHPDIGALRLRGQEGGLP